MGGQPAQPPVVLPSPPAVAPPMVPAAPAIDDTTVAVADNSGKSRVSALIGFFSNMFKSAK
jgi:hypothetical protein